MAENETPAAAAMLVSVAKCLRERETVRSALQLRVDRHSLGPLSLYPALCGRVLGEVRAHRTAIDVERKKRSVLDNAIVKEGTDPIARAKIMQGQSELDNASKSVVQTHETLNKSIMAFEQKRRLDLQASLSELIYSEMQLCARSLELLTEAHQAIHQAGFDSDIDVSD
ncbi:hypothetical protein BC831DRAFT_403962 [Entophlyctis helioformis]|nr:hypothetical protein BC831DRAFT_403962 [Entophlyctis helioformis]